MGTLRVALVTALTPLAKGELEPGTGVLTLTSILRRHYETHYLDTNLYWNQVGRCSEQFLHAAAGAILDTRPDVVGFGSICGTYPLTVRLAQRVREGLPGAHVVFGGPHASVVDTATLEAFDWVDAVIRGEAETSFPSWLEAISAGGPVDGIPGLTFRQSGGIQRNRDAPATLDLDSLPLPAFDLHPGVGNLRVLPLEIGRGCPFGCTFCSTNDYFRRRFRLKSPACVVSQMHALRERFGVTSFDLVHDMFTVNRRKVVEFCDEMHRNGPDFTWTCSARTDFVDEELLLQMRDSGCRGIFFGLETGSQRLQSEIDKGLDIEHACRMVELCDSLGVTTTASFIAGYPTETREDFDATVRCVSRLSRLPTVGTQLHIMSPLPKTPLTHQYWDQIYFDQRAIDDSESGLIQDREDCELITRHRDIFANFYAFPCSLDRHFLRRAAGFFFYGWVKCSGLMQAVHRRYGDMLKIFEVWDRIHYDKNPAYFETWEFAADLVDFMEQEFGGDHDPAVVVTTRFYRAFAASFEARRTDISPDREAHVTLGSSVFLVTVEGNISRVLEDLYHQRNPDPACVSQVTTVVVREKGDNQCGIIELPDISLAVLKHAQQGSAISEVVADFEERDIRFGPLTPQEVVHVAIEKLVADEFIRLILPTQAHLELQALTSA